LNKKNTVAFRPGMVFSLAVSFAGLKLNENARASINSKSAVSMMYCICIACSIPTIISHSGSNPCASI
jgi:hypothetical protein